MSWLLVQRSPTDRVCVTNECDREAPVRGDHGSESGRSATENKNTMFVIDRLLVWMVCTGVLGWEWRPVAGAVDTTVCCWLGNMLTHRMSPSFWRGSVIFGVTCASFNKCLLHRACDCVLWNFSLSDPEHSQQFCSGQPERKPLCPQCHLLRSRRCSAHACAQFNFRNIIILLRYSTAAFKRTLHSIHFPPQFNLLCVVAKSWSAQNLGGCNKMDIQWL